MLGGTDQDGSGDDWGWDSGDHASGGGGGGGQDSDESLQQSHTLLVINSKGVKQFANE